MTEMVLTGPKQTLFTEQLRAALDKWIAKYPIGRAQSAVIPCLHILQEANGGWLSRAIMDALAEYLSMSNISVYEVATFYSMFELEPVGKHKISLCTNISCMLCGSEEILEYLQQRLAIKPGETTADGLFTLKEVECLGACVGAPMLLMDKQYHEYLTKEKIDALIDGVQS
ncbi:NADH dehydrogenase subunit E [Methylophaga marina]|uniref:NADH-quinone oxidoreductase subunit E n=1 Tax=Methylophaga marina TaxID=45495 RepID=A0ABN0TLK8_9GAMM|nr:NADH dehydrogenase subunit E [Methylophaga marina]